MANLATIEVNTNGEYLDLAELADITFTSGNAYAIQIQTNITYLREGDEGEGFLVTSPKPIQFTAGDDTLYIKTDYAIVNIAG
jgi:hypothetical protein